LTRDIESLAGEKLTIQGSSNKNTIDLQGHNLLSSIGESQELSIKQYKL